MTAKEGPGHFIAAGLRLEAEDIAEGRGPWQGTRNVCRRCQRESLTLEDGECAGCQSDAEMRYERRRAEVEKIPRYRRIAEGWREQGFFDQAEALLVYVRKLEQDHDRRAS